MVGNRSACHGKMGNDLACSHGAIFQQIQDFPACGIRQGLNRVAKSQGSISFLCSGPAGGKNKYPEPAEICGSADETGTYLDI